MTTALITGASGYLAHRLLPIAAQHASVSGVCRNPPDTTAHEVTRISGLDLTDADATRRHVMELSPDVIIHAAAANPGSSEQTMWAVNARSTRLMAELASQLGSRLVFISTDIVYRGTCAPYMDSSATDPVNVYGRSKAAGEEAVLSLCDTAVVARTSLIYGLQQIDRGTQGFIDALNAGQTLNLFTDVFRQPVWIDSLCRAICVLAFDQTQETGTINIAGEQVLSRAEFAMKMLHYWDASETTNINPASARDIPGVPLDCTMSLDRALALGIELPGVDDVLAISSPE